MNKGEFKTAMRELGAKEYTFSSILFIDIGDDIIEYIYNNDAEIFKVEVSSGDKTVERTFDIFRVHYKEQILACGFKLYGKVKFEQGATHRIDELKRILDI